MNLNQIRLVYLKEMTDIIRDKRTVRMMILVPVVFYPIMSFGISGLAMNMARREHGQAAPVLVVGGTEAVREVLAGSERKIRLVAQDEFVAGVRALDPVEFKAAATSLEAWSRDPHAGLSDSARTAFYYAAIKGKVANCVLEVPASFHAEAPADSQKFTIYYDEQEFRSDAAQSKVLAALRSYRDSLSVKLLTASGLPEAGARRVLTPFAIESNDVAPAEKKTGFFLALMLPYLIVLTILLGAMYPAIDLTAGEKERGTLETILASAAGRTEVTLGKFLCVFTAAMVTVILGAISMTVTSSFGLMQIGGEEAQAAAGSFQFSVNPLSLFVVVLLMIPTAVLFSAGLLAVAIMARTYKEAQSYISPLMFLVILPSMISFMPGVELNAGLAWVPVSNIALGVRAALLTAKGEAFPWGLLGIVFVATTVYAGFALFLVRQMFNKESVLFRT
jgi:sodium transport system permease protein